ncbi:hypothetical protein GGR53DRAFT_470686 [Hypoxylon sp. FL1150]|nr:hypothetical protein GGR53DRAFT_470686 [Hypoxylon sp. FL1150]
MDIFKKVISEPREPTEEGAKAKYRAVKLVAHSLAQVYHFMIEAQVEYGVLPTRQAIVFLKVDWDKLTTLDYHRATLSLDVPASSIFKTMVGQIVTFSKRKTNSWAGRLSGGNQEDT